MTENTSKILEEVLALPEKDRDDLIDALVLRADTGIETAWGEEIEQRLDDYDSGAVKGIPWDEVRSKLSSHSR